MIKEKINELRELTLLDKVLVIILLLFIAFFLFTQYKFFRMDRIPIIIPFLITPVLLIVLILLRFSNENKAIISFVFGVTGTLYLIINLFDKYTPLNQYLFIPLQMTSIVGLIYGILGLKSTKKSLAISGIIFNILQFATSLIPRYVY